MFIKPDRLARIETEGTTLAIKFAQLGGRRYPAVLKCLGVQIDRLGNIRGDHLAVSIDIAEGDHRAGVASLDRLFVIADRLGWIEADLVPFQIKRRQRRGCPRAAIGNDVFIEGDGFWNIARDKDTLGIEIRQAKLRVGVSCLNALLVKSKRLAGIEADGLPLAIEIPKP
ncbi:hypothetical protein J2Z75_004198 [Rhizobium herbae]|uniref:Uncharacterized protein n=1 Tax=Rhizobium herbae TaxID=508661 RepID=A0ABS4ERW4_9HYPH|nr:hypothetical protein [Rhizobium herbae]MBP1860677.1 hypothetical protein [Rhizobium herbae]